MRSNLLKIVITLILFNINTKNFPGYKKIVRPGFLVLGFLVLLFIDTSIINDRVQVIFGHPPFIILGQWEVPYRFSFLESKSFDCVYLEI